MGTFSRSLALAKQSWSILRDNPQLGLFPLVSSIVTLFVIVSFAIPAIFLFEGIKSKDDLGVAHYALMFGFYLVTYFIVIFFNAGLISCANEIFAGRKATFADGFRNSLKHVGPIFLYALISATVGVILRMISERAGIFGRIVIAILGMAWSILTYFVAPILVLENKSPFAAIKESGMMLRKTWGERLIVNGSLSMVFGLLGALAFIPMAAGGVIIASGAIVPGILVIAFGVIYLIGISLVSTTLQGVFQTAVYMYARTGQIPVVYNPEWVQQAFVQKPAGRFSRNNW